MASVPVHALVLGILALGLALVVGGGINGLRWAWLRRDGDPDPGPVRLTGRCRPIDGESVPTAPVSGRPALYYEWRLERRGGRLARPVWEPVEGASERRPFELETADGPVRIEPSGAAYEPPRDPDVTVDDPETLRETAAELEATVPGPDAAENFRLVEYRLEDGDEVSVTGRLTADGATRRIAGPASPSLVGRLLGVPFVVADADRDGGLGRLRDRAIAGLVLGLPPTLLALVLLFPPPIGG